LGHGDEMTDVRYEHFRVVREWQMQHKNETLRKTRAYLAKALDAARRLSRDPIKPETVAAYRRIVGAEWTNSETSGVEIADLAALSAVASGSPVPVGCGAEMAPCPGKVSDFRAGG
jgi:hypothetical protein